MPSFLRKMEVIKMTKVELINAISESKARSAWAKGVKWYALNLVEESYKQDTDIVKVSMSVYLNGAETWKEYSYGAHSCALVYDYDIAQRLCTPGELKKTEFGRKLPNGFVNWLDVQARALHQAHNLIAELIKAEWRKREDLKNG